MKAVEIASLLEALEPLASAVRITSTSPEAGTTAVADGPSASGT